MLASYRKALGRGRFFDGASLLFFKEPSVQGRLANPVFDLSRLRAFLKVAFPAGCIKSRPPPNQIEERILDQAQMPRRARPTPIAALRDQPGANRIPLNLQQGRPGMFFVERSGVEAGLPQVAHAAQAQVNGASVIAMNPLQGTR